jgi:hypothetical protein
LFCCLHFSIFFSLTLSHFRQLNLNHNLIHFCFIIIIHIYSYRLTNLFLVLFQHKYFTLWLLLEKWGKYKIKMKSKIYFLTLENFYLKKRRKIFAFCGREKNSRTRPHALTVEKKLNWDARLEVDFIYKENWMLENLQEFSTRFGANELL